MDEKTKSAYRVGWTILFLLAILTVGEFFLGAIASVWWAPLLAVASIKAYLIVRDYMHIGRVFAADEVQE